MALPLPAKNDPSLWDSFCPRYRYLPGLTCERRMGSSRVGAALIALVKF